MKTKLSAIAEKTKKFEVNDCNVVIAGFSATINVPIRRTCGHSCKIRPVACPNGKWRAEYDFEGPMGITGSSRGPASMSHVGFDSEAECVLHHLCECLERWGADGSGAEARSKTGQKKRSAACGDLRAFIRHYATSHPTAALPPGLTSTTTPAGIEAHDPDGMPPAEIVIDPEFRDLLGPLAAEEREQLTANLLRDGCLTDLIVWDETGILVDGHNRREICDANDVDYGIQRKHFSNRKEALDWALKHQRGRRGGSKLEARYLRGKEAIAEARSTGRPEKRDQNEPVSGPERTAEKVAKRNGVSPATVKRDTVFAKAVDALAEMRPGLRTRLLTGKVRMSPSAAKAVVKLPPAKRREMAERIENGIPNVDAVLPPKVRETLPKQTVAARKAEPLGLPQEFTDTLLRRLDELEEVVPKTHQRLVRDIVQFVKQWA